MAKLNDLIVTIGAQTRQFDKALGASMRKMQNFGANTKKLGKSMTRSLTMPIAALGAAAIKSAADLETMEVSFISLTGGAKQAADMMANLNEFTAKTPFQIEAVAKSARQLIASGSGIGDVNEQLQFLGDIAATSGQPIDEIAAIFSKVNAKGKVELESLNQLAERGIPIFTALSEATGLPADKLGAGAVSVEQFNSVLKGFSDEGGFAAGAMERLSETASGKFSTALDNLKLAGASLAESLLPTVKQLLDKFVGLMQALTALSPETKKFVLIAAGIAAALGPLLVILPTIIQGFMALLSPVGLVIAAVVGLGIAIVTFADEIAPYITDVINYFITLYNESSLLRGIIGGIKGTVQVVFDFFLFAVDAVIGAFQDLGAIISAVLSGDLSNIGDAISNAFSNAADRMATFGEKAAEDFADAVNTELAREPLELVTKESVANALSTLGGLTNLIPSAISGGGAGATVTPTPTETVTVQADLEFQDIEFIDDADLDEEDIDKVIERTNLVKNQINSIAQSMANFIDSTFKSIIAGTATFEEVMRDMIKQMLIQLASLIAQFAILSVLMPSSLVGKGGNVMSLGKFIGGGFGIPQMASGGIVSGPVIAQVGEYAGAQHNPEVIAPLDKLQAMMGGQSVQVTGKISGRDILLTSERNAIDRNRVRGF
jgi:tape measure domain-containing protein